MVQPVNGHVSAQDLIDAGVTTIIGTTSMTYNIYRNTGFYKCNQLKSIEIPDTVTEIGNYAFYNAAALESVDFSNATSLKTIGIGAFKLCTNLNSVILPDGLIEIGSSAFEKSALTSVTIPSSVTEIKNDAFWDCHDLVSVDFSHAVNLTTVGIYAFQDTRLVAVDLSKTALTKIRLGMFEGCITLTSVTLPDDLTEIGQEAFKNTGLTSVTVPVCTHVVDDAFQSTTTVSKYFSRGCLDNYVSDGITSYAEILSSFTPQELKDAYRAKNACPN